MAKIEFELSEYEQGFLDCKAAIIAVLETLFIDRGGLNETEIAPLMNVIRSANITKIEKKTKVKLQ